MKTDKKSVVHIKEIKEIVDKDLKKRKALAEFLGFKSHQAILRWVHHGKVPTWHQQQTRKFLDEYKPRV